MSFGGGGSSAPPPSAPTSTTTTAKSEPWEEQKPHLIKTYQEAERAFNQARSMKPYSGDLYAKPTSQQQEALGWTEAAARQAQSKPSATSGLASGLGESVRGREYLQPALTTGADVSNMLKAQMAPMAREVQEQLIPQLRGASIEAGSYGGTRQGVEEGRLMRGMGEEAARLGYQDYAQRRSMLPQLMSLEQQAMQMVPSLEAAEMQAAVRPAQILSSVGDVRQQQAQKILQEAYDKQKIAEQVPWQGLGQYAGLVNQGNFMTNTQNLASQYASPSTGGQLGGAFSGALGGAGMGAAATALAPATAGLSYPLMMGGGALLGGLGGFFG